MGNGRTLLIGSIKAVNRALRAITSLSHRVQLHLEWTSTLKPEWFDHFIDQYQWRRTQNPLPWERGVFGLLAIKPGASVLELCCGDGFNAHHFYSTRAKTVQSVDWNTQAIAHARRHFHAPNVTYDVLDIRQPLPTGDFDNVILDAAIGHFSAAEVTDLLKRIRERLTPEGILCGYTNLAVENPDYPPHKYEYKSKADLARVLKAHFKNVLVWQTEYQIRNNLYFFASDGVLPFDREWSCAVRS